MAGTFVLRGIVNSRQFVRRAGEVNQVTRATCLPARTHLAFTSGEHLFDLEPALLLLLMLTLASLRALAGNWLLWLLLVQMVAACFYVVVSSMTRSSA